MGEQERCECGAVGVHPYPIGGGWAFACDDCKASSLVGVDGAVTKHEAKVEHALRRAERRAAAERRMKKATDREVERHILKRLIGRDK